ncbi:MAG: transposase [Candidatus Marinimicrobia bacterium]|nr:transposase [Candidatus Neomarinimicrobiota bacterium]
MALSFDRADLSAGCVVHIFNRGNDQQTLFNTGFDYDWFTDKALKLDIHNHFEVIAYCLMPNHFHYFLKLKTEGSVSVFFQRLQLSYAKYFNRKYQHTGHVFSGPFRSVALEDFRHYSYLPKYIHMNPVRARLVITPEDWPFSNYSGLINQVGIQSTQFYNDTYGSISEYIHFIEAKENEPVSEYKAITFE